MDDGLSSAVRKLRWSLGITQKRLAEMLGVTSTTIIKYESGAQLPKWSMLLKLGEIAHEQGDLQLAHILRSAGESKIASLRALRVQVSQRALESRQLQRAVPSSGTSKSENATRLPLRISKEADLGHRLFWHAARHQVGIAKEKPTDRYRWFTVVYLLVSSAESYMNFLLTRIEVDRNSIRTRCSLKDQVDNILALTSIDLPQERKSALDRISKVAQFRDKLYHVNSLPADQDSHASGFKVLGELFAEEPRTEIFLEFVEDTRLSLEWLNRQVRAKVPEAQIPRYALSNQS